MIFFKNLLLATLLLIAIDVSAQGGGPWKVKTTAGGGFMIRDQQWGLDVFQIEPNSSANALYIDAVGRVAVGTTTPSTFRQTRLDVEGDLYLSDPTGSSWMAIDQVHPSSQSGFVWTETGGIVSKAWLYYDYGSDWLLINGESGTGWRKDIVIHNTGEVCMGTSDIATGYKLSVDGKVACREVLVKASGSWPDYVFAEDYKLLTLKQLEKSVEQNNHLPGIPSAKEVEENGFTLGEMQRLVLEKVEELTLYTIEQGKQIEELQNRIKDLEEENNKLKK